MFIQEKRLHHAIGFFRVDIVLVKLSEMLHFNCSAVFLIEARALLRNLAVSLESFIVQVHKKSTMRKVIL